MLFHNLYSRWHQYQLVACLHVAFIEMTLQVKQKKETENKKLNTPTKSYLKESMKGSWYEQDGLPYERSTENVTSSTSCSQRKLIDWQTKNESSGDEDSDSGSEEEDLPVFNWIVNIKFLNENLKEVAICKYCKNVLILTEKVNQRAGLTTELAFRCKNDKCKSYHDRGLFTSTKSRAVYNINRKRILASRAV